MWRGAISVGMVAIPIRMYLATESKSVSFRLLCPEHRVPIKNKRCCSDDDHEIGWSDVIRGYEVSKDEFVEIADKDLDELPLHTTHTIDILEFCADSEIEAGVYIKSAYYLEPEAVGAKPYALLRAALGETKKVAIGKIALRDREHLCRLTLHGDGILLNTLHWPDEIRDAGELSIPTAENTAELNAREIEMAIMLVDNLSANFDPARYRDDYRDAVLAVVEAKLHDQPVIAAKPVDGAKVTDLMAALKASVEASATKRDATPAGKQAPEDHVARAARTTRAAEPARRRKAS